jgi:group I intron endonuclease
MIGIYKIQSKIKPKRCYIGSAINIKSRWNSHLSKLAKNTHPNIKLQRHYNKYGKDDLIFEVLISCEKEELIKYEQFFIDVYKSWFNICPKAQSRLGVKCSIETIKKMSEVNKGHKAWNKGIPQSEETKKKLSIALKGRKFSDETIKRMSKGQIGRKMSKESIEKTRKANLGNKHCLGHKNALGYKHTELALKKISEASKRIRKEKREYNAITI